MCFGLNRFAKHRPSSAWAGVASFPGGDLHLPVLRIKFQFKSPFQLAGHILKALVGTNAVMTCTQARSKAVRNNSNGSRTLKRFANAVASLSLLLGVNHPVQAQLRVANVIVAKTVKKEVATGQPFVGTVIPLKKSSVGTAVDGRVSEFPINEGDRVNKGQPLAKLLTETINLSIVAAQAELKFREEELREQQNGWRKEEIEQAAAKTMAAMARRDYAAQRLKRTQLLFEKGQIGTPAQLEEDKSTADATEQAYQAERLNLDLMKQGHRVEKLEQTKARVAEQTAIVSQLQDQLKKHTMIAPFDGYIVAERTEVGEWVTRGQVVAEVIYLDEVDVEAHVLDTHIEHVRVGMKVRVEVPALKHSLFVGTVAIISPQADPRSRTFPVKVRVKNEIRTDGPLLKAGMLARVSLPTGEPKESMLVPKDAIVLGGLIPTVWVALPLDEKDKLSEGYKDLSPAPQFKVRPVAVELGVADESSIAVTGTINEGQQVVIIGNERLQPNQYISIVEDKPSPEQDATNSKAAN